MTYKVAFYRSYFHIPVLNDGVVSAREETELIRAGEFSKMDRTSMSAKLTEWLTCFNIEDLNAAGVGSGGDESSIRTVRG
jgi:hypothetical protein